MNIIVISRPNGRPVRRSLHAPQHFLALGLATAVTLAAVSAAGYAIGRWHQTGGYVSAWQARLADQHQALAKVRQTTRDEVDALSAQLAGLQSRMTRLDALGRKLIAASHIDGQEFDFDGDPGVGGPLDTVDGTRADYEMPELSSAIDALGERMDHRENQLAVLEDVLMERELTEAMTPAGEPVADGWMSSTYGYRQDPFTGKQAWHDGVDFAGRLGSPVHAIAAGVVTLAGERWGYGQVVEITHGDGYVTRYGHNSAIRVEEGEVVRRGDPVAEMGSSGRSTGPHVHLEVLKDGKSVNPWKYVQAGL